MFLFADITLIYIILTYLKSRILGSLTPLVRVSSPPRLSPLGLAPYGISFRAPFCQNIVALASQERRAQCRISSARLDTLITAKLRLLKHSPVRKLIV